MTNPPTSFGMRPRTNARGSRPRPPRGAVGLPRPAGDWGTFTRNYHLAALVLAALTVVRVSAADALPRIFNGKDFAGWKVPDPNPLWKVVDGVLVGENDEALKGGMLYTERAYRDVVVEAEVRWSGEIDSGIMVRKPELQLQIGVSRSLKKDMTCCFYTGGEERYPEAGRGKGVEGLLRPGDWNIIRLQAKGDTFTVWLNGRQVVEYVNPKYAAAAPIGLQVHPGLKMKVEFRNIRAKALDNPATKP